MTGLAVAIPKQWGEVCFTGTRVPVKNLFGYLRAGYTVNDFLEGFPSVTKEQVDALLADSLNHARKHETA